jgi:hypothetical protein
LNEYELPKILDIHPLCADKRDPNASCPPSLFTLLKARLCRRADAVTRAGAPAMRAIGGVPFTGG